MFGECVGNRRLRSHRTSHLIHSTSTPRFTPNEHSRQRTLKRPTLQHWNTATLQLSTADSTDTANTADTELLIRTDSRGQRERRRSEALIRLDLIVSATHIKGESLFLMQITGKSFNRLTRGLLIFESTPKSMASDKHCDYSSLLFFFFISEIIFKLSPIYVWVKEISEIC